MSRMYRGTQIFKPTNDKRTRTELVIFIRPTICLLYTSDAADD